MRKAIFLVSCVTLMTGTAHGDISGIVSGGIQGITVEAYRFNESGGFFEPTGKSRESGVGGIYNIEEISSQAGNNIMVVANGNSQAGRGVVLTPWDKNGQFYNTALNYGTVTYKAPAETNPFSLVAWNASGVNIDLTNSKTTCSVIESVKINNISYSSFDSDDKATGPAPDITGNAKLKVEYTLRNPTSSDIEVVSQPVVYLSSDGSQSARFSKPGNITIKANTTLADTQFIQVPLPLWNKLSTSADRGAWILNAGIQFTYSGNPVPPAVAAPPAGLPACETLLFPVKKP